ncbi:MAG: hypothetical protein GX447_00675 [Elusimicrobia bacterium]|nr:hypothetical protein [Elusimicrobiota bacterium]
MANSRDNAIVLALHAPETEHTFQELKEIFGQERAVHINKDLYVQSYKLSESFREAVKMIAYSKTMKHPDLTWLSNEDPGFLECHGKNYSEMVYMASNLAFTAGCKKAVFINHLCPFITTQHLEFAFSKISEKNCVLGASPEGRVYLAGFTRENLKIMENFSLWQENYLQEMLEKAKRNKSGVTGMEDLVIIKDEITLKKWLDSKNSSSSVFSEILKNAENGIIKEHHKRKRKEKQEEFKPQQNEETKSGDNGQIKETTEGQ